MSGVRGFIGDGCTVYSVSGGPEARGSRISASGKVASQSATGEDRLVFGVRHGAPYRRGRNRGARGTALSANAMVVGIARWLGLERHAPFTQQGRAVAANRTSRWSHFAYAISWRGLHHRYVRV
jgi:hypothetical protein